MSLWPFGRRSTPSAESQLASGWDCASCGTAHDGMFHLAAFAPDVWRGDESYRENGELTLDADFLSEDFCVVAGRNFFVRCVIDIPVIGLEDKFGFGCWGSLSRTNFETYVDRFDAGDYAGVGPWHSWLGNILLDSAAGHWAACTMFPQLDRQRPTLAVAEDDHLLAIRQRSGITAADVFDIYRRYGHEVLA